MLINQGGAQKADGSVCCSTDAPQCQVQAGHRKGTRYLDVTNQRSRFDDALTKETIIALYGKRAEQRSGERAGLGWAGRARARARARVCVCVCVCVCV